MSQATSMFPTGTLLCSVVDNWKRENKAVAVKIGTLITSIQEHGLLGGIGKPEWLKHRKEYSRRITRNDRLIYVVEDDVFVVTAFKGHYED